MNSLIVIILILIIIVISIFLWFNKQKSQDPVYIQEQKRMLSDALFPFQERFGGIAPQSQNPLSKLSDVCASDWGNKVYPSGGWKTFIDICDICLNDEVLKSTGLEPNKSDKIKDIFSLIKTELTNSTSILDPWRVSIIFIKYLGGIINFISAGNSNIIDPVIITKLETLSVLNFYITNSVIIASNELVNVLSSNGWGKNIMYYSSENNKIYLQNQAITSMYNTLQIPLTVSIKNEYTPSEFRTFGKSFFNPGELEGIINSLDSYYTIISNIFITNKDWLKAPSNCSRNRFSLMELY